MIRLWYARRVLDRWSEYAPGKIKKAIKWTGFRRNLTIKDIRRLKALLLSKLSDVRIEAERYLTEEQKISGYIAAAKEHSGKELENLGYDTVMLISVFRANIDEFEDETESLLHNVKTILLMTAAKLFKDALIDDLREYRDLMRKYGNDLGHNKPIPHLPIAGFSRKGHYGRCNRHKDVLYRFFDALGDVTQAEPLTDDDRSIVFEIIHCPANMQFPPYQNGKVQSNSPKEFYGLPRVHKSVYVEIIRRVLPILGIPYLKTRIHQVIELYRYPDIRDDLGYNILYEVRPLITSYLEKMGKDVVLWISANYDFISGLERPIRIEVYKVLFRIGGKEADTILRRAELEEEFPTDVTKFARE